MTFVCATCLFEYATVQQLQNHKKCCSNDYTGAKLGYKCLTCKEKFTTIKDLVRHSNESRTECQHCRKIYSNKYNLDKHVNRVHFNIRAFKCDQCEKAFVRGTELEEHKAAIHRLDTRFKCDQCDYASASKYRLRKHIKKHEDPLSLLVPEVILQEGGA